MVTDQMARGYRSWLGRDMVAQATISIPVTSVTLPGMGGLHRKRARRPASNQAYAAMLLRMHKAYDRRAEDETSLAAVWDIEANLRELATVAADRTNLKVYLAQRGGQSYSEIAQQMGMTKAAVIKRAKLGEAIVRQRAQTQQAMPTAPVAQPRELPPRAAR
jgi:hypothetical protein